MKSEQWQEINLLFHSALDRGPGQRAAFLDQACAGDESLRKEVDALIAAHDQAGSFIEAPAFAVAAEMLADDQGGPLVGRFLGHYRVVAAIGAGGMGEVYLAQDTRLDRKVALKLLPSYFTMDAERVRRFQQEARAASALNHPNIITIHEIGQVEERHFIATEFIDGETLRAPLSRSLLSLRATLDVTIQVASALVAAHKAGIVHRDIKPENIMVRRDDGIVKVLDFGLVKLTEKHAPQITDSAMPTRVLFKTDAGVVMGTVSYMSPEPNARGGGGRQNGHLESGRVALRNGGGTPAVRGRDGQRRDRLDTDEGTAAADASRAGSAGGIRQDRVEDTGQGSGGAVSDG